MTTSGCSTETERPHRRCKPLNKVKNIDRTRDYYGREITSPTKNEKCRFLWGDPGPTWCMVPWSYPSSFTRTTWRTWKSCGSASRRSGMVLISEVSEWHHTTDCKPALQLTEDISNTHIKHYAEYAHLLKRSWLTIKEEIMRLFVAYTLYYEFMNFKFH